MKTDQYYLYQGELYIKTGVSGRIITTTGIEKYLDDPKYEITYEFIQAYDEKGNAVKEDDKNMPIKINHDDHTITTLKPGYVWYLITVEEKGESGSLTT